MALLDIIFLLLCIIVLASRVNAWSYNEGGSDDPSNWGGTEGNEDCYGTSQSPIDIDTADAIFDTSLLPLTFIDATSTHAWFIENDGHSISVWVNYDRINHETLNDGIPMLSDGGLTTTYKMSHMDWHWGSDDTHGSEHRIDGRAYPMELHLIYYREDFSDYYAAQMSELDNAIVVLAVMYELSDTAENDVIAAVLAQQANIASPNWGIDLTENFAMTSLLPRDLTHYARYSGSLTSPPCSEVVTWTVFMETLPVTAAQVDQMRTSFWHSDTEMMTLNYRPIQERNDRTISLSYGDMSGDLIANNEQGDTSGDLITNNEQGDTSGDLITNNEQGDTSGDLIANNEQGDTSGDLIANNEHHEEEEEEEEEEELQGNYIRTTGAPTSGAFMQCASLGSVVVLTAVWQLF